MGETEVEKKKFPDMCSKISCDDFAEATRQRSVAVSRTWQHRQSLARSCHLDRDVFSSVSDVTTEKRDNNCSIREHAGLVLKRERTRVVSYKYSSLIELANDLNDAIVKPEN